MAESKPETVRRLFDRFEQGQLDAALELLSDDFVAVIPPSLSAEPDTYEGHAGARRYFEAFEGLMEDVRYEVLELIEEGDVVIARVRVAGRGATSGIEVEQFATALHWVTDGKVTRIEPHPDLDAARAALRASG
ncbi:MAG: SnoaL-like domain [Thermoleophilaceae bacterium]|jgi:ketosteroid isomerase-like protein|nr:SnoaL-like domain [Thermoleophilaceae bacterium]